MAPVVSTLNLSSSSVPGSANDSADRATPACVNLPGKWAWSSQHWAAGHRRQLGALSGALRHDIARAGSLWQYRHARVVSASKWPGRCCIFRSSRANTCEATAGSGRRAYWPVQGAPAVSAHDICELRIAPTSKRRTAKPGPRPRARRG